MYNTKLGYDGTNVWTTNWIYPNWPRLVTHFFYYFNNLPWLTQDDNVFLGQPEKGTLPGFDKEYITVDMTFPEAPTVGKTVNDKFVLFIDPDTYLLQGYHYYIGYGTMLDYSNQPADKKAVGPNVRIIKNYINVEGLLMPSRYYTTNLKGDPIGGHHTVLNYSITKQLDEALIQIPPEGKIDKSSELRKTK